MFQMAHPTNRERRKSLTERVSDRIVIDEVTGCWMWTGASERGYGRININGHHRLAHKALYEDKFGPVPVGLELDHFICERTLCVNPDHVEPVTHCTNLNRGARWR